MQGYIYSIICESTGKRYIGITEDLKRRFTHHKSDLNLNKHHSPKLQNAWNYYGSENFTFAFREVEINCYDDLYELEKQEIAKFDSYNNGYNCNPGGKISDWKQKVDNVDIVDFLCVQYVYGNGFGKTFEEIKGWSKGTASAAKRKIRFLDANCTFESLSEEEKQSRAKQVYESLELGQNALKRQFNQGGCEKVYSLTQNDFYFAFAAQSLNYGYSCVALHLGIKPNTVKDWFNGRSRQNYRKSYDELPENDKEKYRNQVKCAKLEELENIKEKTKRTSLNNGSV